MVGLADVFQQTPLAVTAAPPSAVTLPPLKAVVAVMEEAGVVVTVGVRLIVTVLAGLLLPEGSFRVMSMLRWVVGVPDAEVVLLEKRRAWIKAPTASSVAGFESKFIFRLLPFAPLLVESISPIAVPL